jgi:3-dehydroquinate synthase
MNTREIKVKAVNLTYRVLIEPGSIARLGRDLRLLFPSTKTMLVSDTTVYKLYGEEVTRGLKAEGWQVSVALIKPGERAKSLKNASRLYDQAIAEGLDRNSPLIALGGGVVGDLAGFVAATYLRGVPLVMVPTTLLAQVDSSVGGKVAVNHPGGKNLIGSIYPPRLVLIDPEVLKTLPKRQLKAGLAEVVKYGIISDHRFFAWLEHNCDQLLKANLELLTEAITLSVLNKAKVVEADEYEQDQRRILNFGHTVGHALEAATDYRHYLHGEAVLSGMLAAVKLAQKLNEINLDDAERIEKLIGQIGLKKAPEDLTTEAVIDKLRQDKKRLAGEIFFVLPNKVGSVSLQALKDRQLLYDAVKNVLN